MLTPKRKRWLRIGARIAAVYAICLLSLVVMEPRFVYQPFDGPTEPKAAGLPQYVKGEFTASDDLAIPYWEHKTGGPLILYLHGNGGGLHAFQTQLIELSKRGFHVMAMEYRGYPGAPGKPTEASITADALAFFDHARKIYPRKKITLWGYSLGSGFATQVAASREASGLVLEAPFTALDDRGAEIYSIFPIHLMMRNKLRSIDVIHTIGEPLFIMHGGQDLIIPDHHGKALFDAASEPKIYKFYPQANHFTLPEFGAYDEAAAFVRRVVR